MRPLRFEKCDSRRSAIADTAVRRGAKTDTVVPPRALRRRIEHGSPVRVNSSTDDRRSSPLPTTSVRGGEEATVGLLGCGEAPTRGGLDGLAILGLASLTASNFPLAIFVLGAALAVPLGILDERASGTGAVKAANSSFRGARTLR